MTGERYMGKTIPDGIANTMADGIVIAGVMIMTEQDHD
jgi:hypothetical protein